MAPYSYLCVLLLSFIGDLEAWGSNNKVKMTDVKTITLRHGQMTTGRRSNPVPQLQCVGGTAGCSAFFPQVVQCYNRGSDGIDVQWECKTDMDNAFRFGRTDVVCEGYEYPDDPYILKGSCGMEYTIDLTAEGLKRKSQGHNYYGGNNEYSSNHYANTPHKRDSTFSNMILMLIIFLVIVALWKTCTRNMQRSPTDDDYSDPGTGYGPTYRASGPPPPPGFRTNYRQGSDESCGSSSTGASPGGGFWSGAATGGILGYMFGNRNSGYTMHEPRNRSWGGGGWGSSSGSSGFGSGSGFGGGSTGTRTASGFGGTRRR